MAKAHLVWQAGTRVATEPAICDQYVHMDETVLSLRNFTPRESAVMARLYAATIPAFIVFLIWLNRDSYSSSSELFFEFVAIQVIFVLFMAFLLYRHILVICSRSNFYFNRITQCLYYRDRKRLWVCDWGKVQAGPRSITGYTGAGLHTSFYLELKLQAVDDGKPLFLRIESNEPNDPREGYVAQVWEYLRQYMSQSPAKLPPPQDEKWWWYQPPRQVYLTPKEALLRYLPWHTGVPGERVGKPWWTLPIWLVMFPVNMYLMLAWWATCKLFKVRPADPPAEAFEGRGNVYE